MEITEILRRFNRGPEQFESEAVNAAIAQQEEIVPGLLHILEEILQAPEAFDPEGNSMGHFYACYLLAQFREARAYPLLVRIAQLPSKDTEALFDDFMSGDFASVLASVCDGDLTGIQTIVENEEADEWARGAAIRALDILVGAGLKSREEILDYFSTLYRGKLRREQKNGSVWSELVCSTSDLYAEELLEDIRNAYAEELIDPTYIDIEDVEADLAMGKEKILAKLASDTHDQIVTDTAKSFAWWACFNENKDRLPDPYAEDLDDFYAPGIEDDRAWTSQGVPFVREGPKIGRNDPCPCGSGKKYKKCCLE